MRRASLVIAMLLLVALAHAEPKQDLMILPHGTPLLISGTAYRGFTLDEYKTLAQIYADYRSCGKQAPLLLTQVGQLQKVNQNYVDQLLTTADAMAIMKEENQRLLNRWTEENKLRYEAENEPKWGGWLPWAIATVASVVATGSLVVLISK